MTEKIISPIQTLQSSLLAQKEAEALAYKHYGQFRRTLNVYENENKK